MLNAFFKKVRLERYNELCAVTVLMCYFALEVYVLEYFPFLKDLQQDCKISLSHLILTNKYLLFKC